MGESYLLSRQVLLFSPSLSQRKEGEGVVKWKGDVRTVVSVSTRRVSIARGLSTMQEMQV